MANLTPVPGWDDVFQLETTTPVLGGLGGPANTQAQNLVNRLAFLETSAGSARIGTTQGSINATARTVQQKLGERISVFDFLTAAEIASVQADNGAVNCTVNFQRAINHVVSVGGTLYVPAGRYLAGPLLIDYSAEILDPLDNRLNRFKMIGDGRGSTTIRPTWEGVCLEYRGGTGGGVTGFLTIEGIAIRGINRVVGSTGLKITKCAYFVLRDFDISLWEYGIDAVDCLLGSVSDGVIRLNVYGYRFARFDFSFPNAISFTDVAIAGNRNYGGLVTGASSFLHVGGSVEGNGTDQALDSPNAWGLKCVNSTVEGGQGLVVFGTYFEGNKGRADVWLVNETAQCQHSINASFNRYLVGQYVTNCVLFEPSGAGLGSTCSVGGGFRGLNTYIESAARPYFAGPKGSISEIPGNFYGDVIALDRSIFSPVRLPVIATADLPSATTNRGGAVYDATTDEIKVSNGVAWGLAPGPVSHVQVSRNTVQLSEQNVMTPIIFPTETVDTLNEYNTGTGVFIAKRTGTYLVSGGFVTNVMNFVAGTQWNVRILVDGVAVRVGDRNYIAATGIRSVTAYVSATIFVTAGQEVALASFTDRTPDADVNNLAASAATSNYMTIDRLA